MTSDFPETLLSEQEIANFFGISRRAVTDLRNEGHVTPAKTKPKFLYNLQDFAQHYTSRLRAVAAGRTAQDLGDDADQLDPVREGALLKRSQREILNLKINEAKGTLTNLPTLQAAIAEVVETARQAMLLLPACLMTTIPKFDAKDRAEADRLVRKTLQDLADSAFDIPEMLRKQALDAASEEVIKEVGKR